MRRYNTIEINQRINVLYTKLIANDSLINAIRIAEGVHKMCKAEKKRRKGLEK